LSVGGGGLGLRSRLGYNEEPVIVLPD
jgi:hypothetical protein